MPVYHYIFHSHGSWMPDRDEGYYKHNEGWKAPNQEAFEQYRKKMDGRAVMFERHQQELLIGESIKAQSFQRIELYAAATDATHLHAVVAWKDDRDAVAIRSQFKSSLTRELNTQYGKQQWFVAKAGQQPVQDEAHLSFLIHDYLPNHTLYWYYKSCDSGGV